MSSLTATELARLALCLPELKTAETRLRAAAARVGIEYVIPAYGGMRTVADQKQLVAWRDEADLKADGKLGADTAGYYPVAPAELSFHGWGAAFDVKITKSPAGMRDPYKTLADLAPSCGLRAGYYFHGGPPDKRADPFHFELPITLDQAKAKFAASGLKRGAAGVGTIVVIALVGFLFLRS